MRKPPMVPWFNDGSHSMHSGYHGTTMVLLPWYNDGGQTVVEPRQSVLSYNSHTGETDRSPEVKKNIYNIDIYVFPDFILLSLWLLNNLEAL